MWSSWSGIQVCLTSRRTLLDDAPATRPSSPRSTTSFDLRSARRHRGRWGPLPVWPQLFGSQRGEARGGLEDRVRLAEADERHQAARTALRAFARSIDEVALRSRWPPIPSHRPGRDRRSTASTAAPFGRPECGSWADRPLFAGDRALRRSSIAWVRWSGQDPRKTATPPESSGGVAGCPAPTTIAEQLHIQVAPVGSPQGRTAPHGGRNSGTRIGGRPVRVSCDVNERWPSASVGVFLILRFPTLVIVVPCVTTFVLSD